MQWLLDRSLAILCRPRRPERGKACAPAGTIGAAGAVGAADVPPDRPRAHKARRAAAPSTLGAAVIAAAIAAGLAAGSAPGAASAGCDVALLLSIDVSGSVDAGEYRLQADGLAAALADPRIAEALVETEAALSLLHWSGAGMQSVVIPWRRMTTEGEVRAFAEAAIAAPRAFRGADTAVGDALAAALDQFPAVADCRRKVIDISGDGAQNAGDPIPPRRARAEAAGISVNAIAIESLGLSLTEFYRRHVITRHGFVMSARGHLDYADAIRAKILREIGRPAS